MQFDSADHGAALFNLEEEGYRYSRISNPTVAVLEERVAALEGGVGALATASGQAALYYAFANVARWPGGNIVSTPQLYGTTHTLLAHRAAAVRASTAALPPATAPRRWQPAWTTTPRAVFCETRGQSRRQYLRHRGHRAQWRMPMACR